MNDRSIGSNPVAYDDHSTTKYRNAEPLYHNEHKTSLQLYNVCTTACYHLSFLFCCSIHIYTVHVYNIASVRHFVKRMVLDKMA